MPIPEPEPARPDRWDRAEIPRVVHEELGRLPERLRAPIVLCYLEGMTHERAASQLGCPVGTVRSRLARARALLNGRIARRGLVTSTATFAVLLATDAGAATVPPHIPMSLVKTAARIAAGTASLRDGCGISVRVAALLEGVLNVLRVQQIVGSMAALAVIGVVATIVGVSAFSASGQTGDDKVRAASERARAPSNTPGVPVPETFVKTYYVGDLLLPPGRGARRVVDMDPLVDLITSTVATGTWTVDRNGMGASTSDGRSGILSATVAPPRTVGAIKPFFLSISLIVRHTKEGHDEVANLLRKLRRLLESREHSRGADPDHPNREAPEIATPADDRKPIPPSLTPPPDRNARIRHLLDELRKEVEGLPKDQG